MGRGGAASMTSLLNFGEGHRTSMRRRISSFLRSPGSQTAFLAFPRKGTTLAQVSGAQRPPFVSSHRLKAGGSPQGSYDEYLGFRTARSGESNSGSHAHCKDTAATFKR